MTDTNGVSNAVSAANDGSLVEISDGEAFTTSLVIAEGVDNPHKSVLQLVRQNAEDLQEFGTLAFEMRKSGGRPTEFALLNEMQATLLLTYMRNNDVVRAFKKRLVAAFFALRDQKTPLAVLRDPKALRGLLADFAEQNEMLASQIEEQTPKVEALERLSEADGSLNITEAAKALQLRPKELFQHLHQRGWIYKRPGAKHWLGYQHKTSQGLMEHKVSTVTMPSGEEVVREQVRITPKGLARLAESVDAAA